MDDRYQIRSQLGQGGLGSVYKAFDSRMNREVAIKRIVTGDGDEALQKEATEQLEKEAGALASLQHPNIVTVYDVDKDKEGPYVVMELILGKTLDEVLEEAPLTYNDFKELALQIQEGLIAAQELGLVHRDLKPGNVMLNWLPSGKFQVKLVDFGLARLMPKPEVEEVGPNDSIFGSIFFMAPEQFERGLIDVRVDMYAIGCVYYHALAGEYPFNGETGHQVMMSHLNHNVIPLNEIRPDLPHWLCDWIMWHINRLPGDRPESARRALHVFLQNEANPPPPPKKKVEAPKGPQAPTPKLAGGKPRAAARIHTGPVHVEGPPQPKTQSMPKPLAPPEGLFKPSVHTSQVFIGDGPPPPDVAYSGDTAPPAPTGPMPKGPAKSAPTAKIAGAPAPHLAGPRTTFVAPPPKPKKKMKKSEKMALWIAAGLIGVFIAFVAYKFSGG